MICPILSLAIRSNPSTAMWNWDGESECKKENCAWWTKENRFEKAGCAITKIAKGLYKED